MPLTGAEKTRRYREKLKLNRPEEYKAQCKRNLQRMNSKKKKISDMTSNEAEEQRKKWREEKRRSNNKIKEKKNVQPESRDVENETPVILNEMTEIKLRKRCKLLLKKCKNMSVQIQKLKKQKEVFKKRYQRLKQSTTKKITKLEEIIDKQKAREEVIAFTLKTTYQRTKAHRDKKILRKLIQNAKNKKYVWKMIGLKGKGRKEKNKIQRVEIAEITKFYIRDDNSRNTAGKKQTKTKNKIKIQMRYLTDTIVNLFKKYKSEGGRYGFTTFYKHKPFYVISPHLNSRDTCLCIKHSNMEFQQTSLKKQGVVKNGITEILKEISCDITNYSCMYRYCIDCKDRKPLYCETRNGEGNDVNVSWCRWERKDHTYMKTEGNGTKEVKTKKTVKVVKNANLRDLKMDFEKDLQEFKTHYFNMQHQQKQYQMIVSQLKDTEVVLVCDFSENYEAKMGNEIQAMHFGASKNQFTLHTGMIYWKNKSQSFCTISELTNHQPPAIWAHLTPLLNLIKEESPNVSVIHFFSDGPSSQYRQKHNFYLFARFTKQFGFDGTWSFFESGHGKSVADGIGGCIKRTLDRKVCHGIDVIDANDAYVILSKCLKSIKVFLIPDSSIDEISRIVPSNVQALKGTLRVHQIMARDENSVKFRNISCFCGPASGHCDCFSPQIHHVVPFNVQPQPQRKRKYIGCSNAPSTFSSPRDSVPSTSKDDLSPATSSQISKMPNRDLDSPYKELTINLPAYDKEPELKTDDLPIISIPLEDTNKLEFQEQIKSLSFLDLESIENITGFDNFDLTGDVMDTDTTQLLLISNNESNCLDVKNSEAFIDNNVTSSDVGNKKPLKRAEKRNINRNFRECHLCTCTILGKQAKCLACSQWFCEECVDGSPIEFDYICNKCFEG